MSANVDRLRAAHESWNRRDFDSVLRDMADNVVYTDRARTTLFKNKQEFRRMIEEWATAFPDGKLTNATYTDAGNTVIAQMTLEGTNTGPMSGLKATNKRVSLPMCEVCHYDANGRATSSELYYDQFTMLMQLGHIPPLKAAA